MPVLRRISISLQPADVLRPQGYGAGRQPHPRLQTQIEKQVSLARTLVEPQVAYTVVRIQEIDNLGVALGDGNRLNLGHAAAVWHGAEHLAIAVCTIGGALENEVSRLLSAGDLASAAFLDAAGSVAVESLARRAYAHLCQRARRMGLSGGIRLSPGHGAWPLSDQEQVFRAARPERIGVRLNTAFAMLPLKSVSFAMGIGKGLHSGDDRPCLRCEMLHCTFRNTSPLP